MKTDIIWAGGKSMMVDKIQPLIPPHKCRVEVFGGGATFTLMDPPVENMVYNDINQNIVRFFRVQREHYHELQSILQLTPYARQEFYDSLPPELDDKSVDAWHQLWCSEAVDDIEWARRYFIVINLGFTHEEDCKSFRSSKEHSVARAIKNHVDRIGYITERFRSVVIENISWETLVKNYDDEDTLFICDPPYLSSSANPTTYRHVLTPSEHYYLINVLDQCKGQVVLCGYDTALYTEFLREPRWKLHKFTRTAQVGNSQYKDRETRTECVWVKQTKFSPKNQFVPQPLFNLEQASSIEQALSRDLEIM
jgi:DNA adenine methylase